MDSKVIDLTIRHNLAVKDYAALPLSIISIEASTEPSYAIVNMS